MKYKYIGWIPTPRAASATIRAALLNAGILNATDLYDVPNKNGFFVASERISGIDMVTRRWWEVDTYGCRDDTFLFTILRNPFDRAVSSWKHSLRQRWIPRNFSLADYLIFLHRHVVGGFTDIDTEEGRERYYDGWVSNPDDDPELFDPAAALAHGIPLVVMQHTGILQGEYNDEQMQQISDHIFKQKLRPQVWSFPLRPRKGLNFLRFENLHDEIESLCNSLDWPKLDLPHLNKTAQDNDYTKYYTDTTRKLVEMLYFFEIETGNYQGPSSG